MKKLILFISIFAISSFSLFSQDSKQDKKHAIGLRTSMGIYSAFAEASYQYNFCKINRIELDLGIGISQLAIFVRQFSASHHWNMNIHQGLNWYIGPVANFSVNSINFKSSNTYIDFGAGAQLGLEYNLNHLNVPIQFSLDARPIVQFRPFMLSQKQQKQDGVTEEQKKKLKSDAKDFGFAQLLNIGLSIRYTF